MTVHGAASNRVAVARQPAGWALVGVELFVAVGALYGGIGLIASNAIHITDDWLVGTPFDSWVLPGIFLLLVVAAPMTVAAVAELRRRPWAYTASVVAGVAQIGWIIAQWVIMQRYFVLQPVMFTAGAVVVLLAWAAHGRSRNAVRKESA
jgi:hypothetical protein